MKASDLEKRILASDLRHENIDELKVFIAEGKAKLFNLRSKRKTENVENVSAFRNIKRNIARIQTIIREHERAQQG
ncbi:MAG: 50S ribosomal protein L29 [Planctomycetes bacterium]|nr:50S ribosomal protein L29 [Planctomycetota bacterium]